MASLRARLAVGDQLLGVLVRVPAEELTEMAALSGFDFVFLDCEHGPADVVEVRRHVAYAALHGVPTLVRVGVDEPGLVLRVLDAGAAGVVAPHVDDAEQARDLVAAAHYPPVGRRGFATYSRAGRFGTVRHDDHHLAGAETFVVAMIESPLAVRKAADIAAVEGIDAVMIGGADLRASSTEADPPPAAAVAQVNRVLAESPAARMDIVGSRADAEQAYADGAQLVVYNLSHTLMAHLADLAQAR